MPSGVDFGAIRWDAWYTNDGPAAYTARALSADSFRSRAPLHADLSRPRIAYAPTAATMAEEIAAAASGGLSYWAWLKYSSGSSMMAGYDLYAAAPTRGNMPFCWIEQLSNMGSTGNFSAWVASITSNMQLSNYKKVLTNRPILYLFWDDGTYSSSWGGSLANVKAALDALRSSVTAAGLGDPYIVLLPMFSPIAAATFRTGLGLNAMSNYISAQIPENAGGAAYTSLASLTASYWNTLAASGPMVPICMAGWDRRPRIDRPVQWETQIPGAGHSVFVNAPSNSQLADHLQDAVDYVVADSGRCPAQTALIYAWNEFDEGGWLAPTHGDPTGARLAAIAPVIEN